MIFLDVDLGIDYKVMRYGDFRVQQARAQISGKGKPASDDCWEKELHNNRPKTWGIVPGREPGPCSNQVFFPLVPVRLFLTSVPLMVSIQGRAHRRGSEESLALTCSNLKTVLLTHRQGKSASGCPLTVRPEQVFYEAVQFFFLWLSVSTKVIPGIKALKSEFLARLITAALPSYSHCFP